MISSLPDGMTAQRLVDAVNAGDEAEVRRMLAVRPQLASTDLAENDERRALHYAVFARNRDLVRILMQHGADARQGVWPHRSATSPLTIAQERGYREIVEIIFDEERRRAASHGAVREAPWELFDRSAWSDGRAAALISGNPELVRSSTADGWTPLHAAAAVLDEQSVRWLIARGADVNGREKGGYTPLDIAASGRGWDDQATPEAFRRLAATLIEAGAAVSSGIAVALGDADWLRTHHADHPLTNPVDWSLGGGLLTIAVRHDQPGILALLLDFGFDPDERVRLEGLDETVYSAGSPLHLCASQGKLTMARMLLERGADPNAEVYASGSVMYSAHHHRQPEMTTLLEQYGGFLDAASVGWLSRTDLARELFDAADAGRLRDGVIRPDQKLPEVLLWAAANGGDPEIVRMALERIDWPRDDPQWNSMLYCAMSGGHLECFRQILRRCDASVRHPRFGRTSLHDVATLKGGEALAFAAALLDAGAQLDVRDDLLKSTPLGWACRWGRPQLVQLLIDRGAEIDERDTDAWTLPRAWAARMAHREVLALLDG